MLKKSVFCGCIVVAVLTEDSVSDTERRDAMEFHENRARRPFIGFVMLWQAFTRWRRQARAKRVLQRMSDAQLRDMGLERDDIC